jgi:EAL domain-containing protein (putative c-di-GMP-specific phosphodiesterase class I)
MKQQRNSAGDQHLSELPFDTKIDQSFVRSMNDSKNALTSRISSHGPSDACPGAGR